MIILLSFNNDDDKDKFEFIYERYKGLMLYKSYEILKDYRLAEDAVSEAFIRIYKNLHKIDNPTDGRTASFVVTIVKNTSLTLLEKQGKNTFEGYESDMADGFDLEDYVISEVLADDILNVIDNINEDLKSVFLLKYAYDMSHKEIGKTLNISENNVTVRLHRAKKKIIELLKKEGYAYEKK